MPRRGPTKGHTFLVGEAARRSREFCREPLIPTLRGPISATESTGGPPISGCNPTLQANEGPETGHKKRRGPRIFLGMTRLQIHARRARFYEEIDTGPIRFSGAPPYLSSRHSARVRQNSGRTSIRSFPFEPQDCTESTGATNFADTLLPMCNRRASIREILPTPLQLMPVSEPDTDMKSTGRATFSSEPRRGARDGRSPRRSGAWRRRVPRPRS